MLNTPLVHPALLRALASAGHGSLILIADGNYPTSTASNPDADLIFLNLSPGVVDAKTVLEAVAVTVPIEAAAVMAADLLAPEVPPIWADFTTTLHSAGHTVDGLHQIPRHDFYARARGPEVAAVIATGETAIYANLMLTIGVRT